jgi:hypothetical protein
MNFFYIEKKIEDTRLSNFLKLERFSKISFMRSNFKKIIIDSIPEKINVIIIDEDELLETHHDDSTAIFWCSNIIHVNDQTQHQFIQKIACSIFSLLFGTKNSYIFKGRLSQLKSILNDEAGSQILNLKNETHLKRILNISDFREAITENSHTRHFNKILSNKERFTKVSAETEKLESEFLFLKNIPEDLRKYYVQVFNFQKNKVDASYTMQKIAGIDLSIAFINAPIRTDRVKNILQYLGYYFKDLKKHKSEKYVDNLKFIIDKNNERHDKLRQWKGYSKLNNFIKLHTSFNGVSDLYSDSNKHLKRYKKLLHTSYFSHGDLCLSNMIFSEEDNKITFIDPRGGEAYRTPYYDLAKLSHSLLGGYDHIINNIATIQFDNSMGAYVDFNEALDQKIEGVFSDFCHSLGYEIELVRKIEASLFISMLPLHVDDERKLFMLALRASELLKLKI